MGIKSMLGIEGKSPLDIAKAVGGGVIKGGKVVASKTKDGGNALKAYREEVLADAERYACVVVTACNVAQKAKAYKGKQDVSQRSQHGVTVFFDSKRQDKESVRIAAGKHVAGVQAALD